VEGLATPFLFVGILTSDVKPVLESVQKKDGGVFYKNTVQVRLAHSQDSPTRLVARVWSGCLLADELTLSQYMVKGNTCTFQVTGEWWDFFFFFFFTLLTLTGFFFLHSLDTHCFPSQRQGCFFPPLKRCDQGQLEASGRLCQGGRDPPVQFGVGGPAHRDSKREGGVLPACLGGHYTTINFARTMIICPKAPENLSHGAVCEIYGTIRRA
jgi:hypothetical protein